MYTLICSPVAISLLILVFSSCLLLHLSFSLSPYLYHCQWSLRSLQGVSDSGSGGLGPSANHYSFAVQLLWTKLNTHTLRSTEQLKVNTGENSARTHMDTRVHV